MAASPLLLAAASRISRACKVAACGDGVTRMRIADAEAALGHPLVVVVVVVVFKSGADGEARWRMEGLSRSARRALAVFRHSERSRCVAQDPLDGNNLIASVAREASARRANHSGCFETS